MIEAILAYVANNSILIGAATAILQLLVIIINTTRKLRKAEVDLEPAAEEIVSMRAVKNPKKTSFLWVCNPINLFRKP